LRLALPLRSDSVALSSSILQSFAMSSDGTRFVYIARDSIGQSLFLQDLATGEFKRLGGTADAYKPLFSSDGRAIGFMAGSGFKIVPIDGGLPREIAPAAAGLQANNWNWNGPDRIVATGPTGLWTVPVNGGAAEAVAKLAPGDGLFRSAVALPGGSYLVSAVHELVSIDRDSGAVRPVSANLRQFALPRLSPDGTRLAMEIQDSPHQIWMLDLERDVLTQLTTEKDRKSQLCMVAGRKRDCLHDSRESAATWMDTHQRNAAITEYRRTIRREGVRQ
jgi:Tol biopolymer transport system component